MCWIVTIITIYLCDCSPGLDKRHNTGTNNLTKGHLQPELRVWDKVRSGLFDPTLNFGLLYRVNTRNMLSPTDIVGSFPFVPAA